MMPSVDRPSTGSRRVIPEGSASTKRGEEASTSTLRCLRLSFVLSLLVAAITCGFIAYKFIRHMEHSAAASTYESVASSAMTHAKALTHLKIEGISLLADLYMNSFPNASEWPFVASLAFGKVARHTGMMVRPTYGGPLTNVQSFAFNPLVWPNQIPKFEQFAQRTLQSQGYPEDAGVHGIFAKGPTQPVPSSGHGTDYNASYIVTAPIFQFNRKDTPVILFDLHSTNHVGPWIESLLDCSAGANDEQNYTLPMASNPSNNDDNYHGCIYATSMHFALFRDEPTVNLGAPIYAVAGPDRTVVGLTTTTVHWTTSLTGITPEYVEGLEAVIEAEGPQPNNSRNNSNNDKLTQQQQQQQQPQKQAYTYGISHGIATLRGEGDLHDRNMDKYAKSCILIDLQSASAPASYSFRLTIYPTNQTFRKMETNLPCAVGLGLTAVIVFCAVIFFFYDFFVQAMIIESRRRKAVLAMKRRFVRFVSHEVRTPLNTVCMGLELLQAEMQNALGNKGNKKPTQELVEENQPETNHQQVEFPMKTLLDWQNILTDLKENSDVSVSVLNDILSIDKIEAGTFSLEMAPLDVWELVRKTAREFQIQAKNRNVVLSLREAKASEPLSFEEDALGWEDLEGGLCHHSSSSYVIGDSFRLAQVFRNLISNALKFASHHISITMMYDPNGLPRYSREAIDGHDHDKSPQEKPRSSFLSSSHSFITGSFVLKVEDDGAGIDNCDDIFGEGIQVDANKLQHGGGSGLGLFIARNIVLNHGGSIEAKSDGLGKGSTFRVELPLHEKPPTLNTDSERSGNGLLDTSNELATSSLDRSVPYYASRDCAGLMMEKEDHQTSAIPSSTPNNDHDHGDDDNDTSGILELHQPITTSHVVLVAEDVPSNSKMLIRILERAGHTCVAAMNGKEAIDVIREDMVAHNAYSKETGHDAIDTILMDYEMPVLNGPEASKKIREMGWTTGNIFGVTGNVLPEDVKFFLDHGADRVIPKPVKYKSIEECWQQTSRSTARTPQRTIEDNCTAGRAA